MISATPLPVSNALAGQTIDRLRRKMTTISMTAQVRIAARICGMLTGQWRPTCPRAWRLSTTAAMPSLGSRLLGRISGYALPPMEMVRSATSASRGVSRHRPSGQL